MNPPIRPREDVEALWEAVLDGSVAWVVSDHACCKEEMKLGPDRENVWQAKAGFGGSEFLLAGLFSEGTRRGLSPNRIAELVSLNPAQRFGLNTKGDLLPGFDADIALLDPYRSWTVHAADSESTQGYTPFEGFSSPVRFDTPSFAGPTCSGTATWSAPRRAVTYTVPSVADHAFTGKGGPGRRPARPARPVTDPDLPATAIFGGAPCYSGGESSTSQRPMFRRCISEAPSYIRRVRTSLPHTRHRTRTDNAGSTHELHSSICNAAHHFSTEVFGSCDLVTGLVL